MKKKMITSIATIIILLLAFTAVAYSQGLFPFGSLRKKGPPWEQIESDVAMLKADVTVIKDEIALLKAASKIMLESQLQSFQILDTHLAQIEAAEGTVVGYVFWDDMHNERIWTAEADAELDAKIVEIQGLLTALE